MIWQRDPIAHGCSTLSVARRSERTMSGFKRGDPTHDTEEGTLQHDFINKIWSWVVAELCRNVSVNTQELCIFRVPPNQVFLDAESDYQSDPTMFVPSEKSWALTENPDQNEDYGSKTLFVIVFRRLISEICKGRGGNSSQTNFYIV